MKLVRFGIEGKERPGLLQQNGVIRDLSSHITDINPAFLHSRKFDAIRNLDPETLPTVSGKPRLAEPVTQVGKFICVGLNYEDHARESGMEIPGEPVLFMKATSAIQGAFDDVVLPPDAEKGDWEVELGIVIGKPAKNVPEKDALDHIAGLTVINDISERAYQLDRGGQWVKGKSCDSFGPIGPWLVTLDEIENYDDLSIWLELNGERIQNSNTSNMIFKLPFLVHYISRFMSLQPGDIISTGTPPGVGLGMKPQRWLNRGDVMQLGIDGLGVQKQRVV